MRWQAVCPKVLLHLGSGSLLGSHFSGEVVNTLFDAFAHDVENVGGDLGIGSLQEVSHRLLVVLNERLVDERDFLEELLDGAFGDAFEHGFGLAGFAGLFDGDAAFGVDQGVIDAGFVDSLRLGGGDVHGDVVGELFVAADHVDENADTGAMDILFNEALSFDAGEAAERHVFADLADESLADAFNRGFTERELEERSDVGECRWCSCRAE